MAMVLPPGGLSGAGTREIRGSPVPPTPAEEPPAAEPPGGIDLDALRELRVEVQDLQTILESIRKGDSKLVDHAPYVKKTMDDIAQLLGQIGSGGYADTMRRLHNIWEQMRTCPLLANPTGQFIPQEQTRHLNTLDAQCRRLVFEIGYVTIPPRINEWLAGARPGYYIPFHAVFEDELPVPEDRVALLNFLAWSPKALAGGLVDAENGLIYRYSRDARHRLVSFLLLVGAVVMAAGIVVGAAYLPVAGWPLKRGDLSTLLVGWVAVLAGVVVHLGVGTAKHMQSQRGHPPIVAVGDLPLMINAKSGQILLKLLLTLVGFFGLVFAAGVANAKPLSAFLVGYSLDSVVELFEASIQQKAASQVGALKERLGLAGKA